MSTIKSLKQLLLEQRGLCFFCRNHLPTTEASVEHLIASSKGGTNCDDNLVACCKLVNNMLGSKSVKQKIRFLLNQPGRFQCPNDPQKMVAKITSERYARVVKDLKKRGKARPKKLAALKNTIASLFPKKISQDELNTLVQQLERRKVICVNGTEITYV